MYPRAPDLASPPVQQYSDAELFWIIHRNFLKLMPFASAHPGSTVFSSGSSV